MDFAITSSFNCI